MADSHDNKPPQPVSENTEIPTPPRITPSPDATESEFKLSRKREREVSLEPATTPLANDTDPLIRERKDSRIPLKKNRRRLDPTEEEEDGTGSGSRSGSVSPPTATILESPRQEMKNKVRQISRGVEDITWKGVDTSGSDKNGDVDIASMPLLAPPTALGKANDQAREDSDVDNTMTDDHEIPPEDFKDTDIEPGPSLAPPITLGKETDQFKEKESVKDTDNTMADDYETPPKTPEISGSSRSIQDVQAIDTPMILASPMAAKHLRVGSESEKGLKRKYLERGTSHGPPESGEPSAQPNEPLKRPRDGSEQDDNPREAKRPSPPPSPPRPSPPSPKIPKLTGFMAYASTNSPFSTVKGQNIFGTTKSGSSTSSFGSPAPSTPATESSSTLGQSSSASTPTLAKRTGFDAFSGSTSPFASVSRMKTPILGSTSKLGRAKSPPRRGNSAFNSTSFASYAGARQSFALPAQKRARAGSPESSRSSLERTPSVGVFGESNNGSESGADDEQDDDQKMSFGARLRAGKDEDEELKTDDEKMRLTEQDVMTGEEEEETLHQVRGKLFSLDDNQWKERGTGLLKLNVNQVDGTNARLVMRKDAVYTLLLNITLFPGMRCSLSQDPRYLRFSAIENGVTTTYNLKVSNAKIASDLLEEINANIPS